MNLALLSIKRPVFITSVIIVMLAVGLFCLSKLGVDLFPNVTFPVVTVTTTYPGAGPAEVETLLSKPLEDEVSTISGIKRVTSINREGASVVIAEFTLETDVKFAEQQIRDRVGAAKRKLPKDIEEPVIRRIDPADQPVIILSLEADLQEGELFDLADDVIRNKLEQVNQVGQVEVLGGRKREIQVQLDRNRLKDRELSVTAVSGRLAAAGENIPAGKVNMGSKELVFRSLGQFKSLSDIQNTVVNFFGSDVPVTLRQIGEMKDTLRDERSRVFMNGKRSLFIYAFKQSGANTISVVEGLKKRVGEIQKQLGNAKGSPKLTVIRDGSKWIDNNVTDVKESIFIGILLTIIVVYFFLASGRSTLITGLALPNSLIGAFILMSMAGFTINLMTLLALSLSVGLLVDDAIVVRENIFRHIEKGKDSRTAALEGTEEVRMAVIATTLTILAVFGPVGFLKGVTGQFFKEFGLTICFAMLISLFDALTIAPMLSAYFAGDVHAQKKGFFAKVSNVFLGFQEKIEAIYGKALHFITRKPKTVLALSFVVFALSIACVKFVTKTFLPAQDAGEFMVSIDLPPGTSLDETSAVALKMDKVIRGNSEVDISALTVGGRNGESNVAEFYVHLIPYKKRALNTSGVKEKLRGQLTNFAYAAPKVKDYDAVGGGQRPFIVNISGNDHKKLEEFATKTLAKMKANKNLLDPDIDYRPGKPEFQIAIDPRRADNLGISTAILGSELRAQIEGLTPAKYREEGREYDVRVRLKDEERNLRTEFNRTYIPNLNGNLVRLADVAKGIETEGPSQITRQNRTRYIALNADIAPGGGLGNVMNELDHYFKNDLKLPPEFSYVYIGQAENMQELGSSMLLAMGFGILFIYLILASLYESFVTPFTIMLAVPLALCGAFVALLIARESLNIFSMIGCILLIGVATKNSILLVDYAKRLTSKGVGLTEAIIESGKSRLRPILMTSMALIAGTLPIALGLNEASKQRTSMGVAIIGGLISSTLLTLIVVPASFAMVERFRVWSSGILGRVFISKDMLSNGKARREDGVVTQPHSENVHTV